MSAKGETGRPAPLPSRLVATPWLALILSVTVWGGNIVVARLAVGQVSPMALVALRWLVVCALAMAWSGPEVFLALRRLGPHWRYLGAMGATGFTASNAMLFWGANYTSGLNIAIVTAIVPALVVAGASVFYRARLTAPRAVGVAMTIIGVLLVATQGDLGAMGAMRFNVGDLIELIGVVCYAGFTLALRHKPDMPSFAFFIGLAIAAFASSLPAMGYEIVSGAIIWPTFQGWGTIVYVAVFTSIIGHTGWIKTVGAIGPSRAGVFQNLVPIIGAGLSVLLLGETFHWYHGASLGLVLGGIFVSERLGR